MGGVVSAGSTNAELVDNLVNAGILKTPEIEQVFRAVDRGVYYLSEYRDSAYKDRAWKHKNLHLSAPCIYGEVMEALELRKGLSFLNLGSGTGYLSTMAGLILGTYGINHGVEYHQDVVDYSEAQLKNFVLHNDFFDAFEFCPPIFHCGNCLNLSATAMKYDRVYCGAACPPENENFMKSLVKVGGLLVMPLGEELVKVKRLSETKWECNGIMAVSFADLIPPNCNRKSTVELSEPCALSLQEVCRVVIRRVLRKNIEHENPETKLFILQCNNRKKNQNNDYQKSLDNDDICDFSSSASSANQYPFIRVSFLPSGGRFMFIRSLSDNDNDEDLEGDSESQQHSDDANNGDVHDLDSDSENNDAVDQAVDPEVSIDSILNSNSNDTTKRDSPITDKINAVSIGKNQQIHGNNFETFDEKSNEVDKKHFQEGLKRNNVSSECNGDQLESKVQTFKKQKMSQEVDKSYVVRTPFTSDLLDINSINGSTSEAQGTSKCHNESKCTSEKSILNENEICNEKSRAFSGPSCDGDVGHLISTSSGISTHESLEMDDITGFDSLCEQQELQTHSSISMSSSLSLSSPHSRSSNQLNTIDSPHALYTLNGDCKGDSSRDREEITCTDESVEAEIEHLDYRKQMKDKISYLPIPFMLKKFLLYYRD